MTDYSTLTFASPSDWEKWLTHHHGSINGVWLKLAKKDSGIPTVTYAEALEVALCWGWIDGQKQKFDDTYWLQKFTPRRARSGWSKVNCGKVERLITSGHMQPAGLKEVEAAKADDRWDNAYSSQSTALVPEDFAEALAKSPTAEAFFPFLYRIQTTKKPENRAVKIAKYIEMLERGELFHLI